MKITSFKQDNDLVSQGSHPHYIVFSDQVGCAFISAEMAIKWHNMMGEQGVPTAILDLTDYDWKMNINNYKVHDVSTNDGMEGLGIELAIGSQSIIN